LPETQRALEMGADESKPEDLEGDVLEDGERTYDLDVLHDHSGAINCMAVSEDGSILATGSDDNTIRLWTAKTPRCDCIGILAGHTNYITCVVIEEIFVISGSVDKTVRKWDMATCVCLAVCLSVCPASTWNVATCVCLFEKYIGYMNVRRLSVCVFDKYMSHGNVCLFGRLHWTRGTRQSTHQHRGLRLLQFHGLHDPLLGHRRRSLHSRVRSVTL